MSRASKWKSPNFCASAMEIDFITAFGRLLRDGTLRDVFAADPQGAAKQVQLRSSDLPAWLQLVPADVEFQADVLLRKRLDIVKHFVPGTCRRLGEKLWAIFQPYGRVNWPLEGSAKNFDAFQFCRHLLGERSDTVIASEWNRLSFALSDRKLAVHWAELPSKSRRPRKGLQLFLRQRDGRWRESFFYFGL